MRKIIPYLFLLAAYFLFCNMTCEEDGDMLSYELLELDVANVDFSGKEMTLVEGKTSKEAFVVAVKCFGNMYRLENWYSEEKREKKLLEENVIVTQSYFDNTEVDFQILTVNAFDDQHPADSDVTHCFIASHELRGEQMKDFSYTLIMRKMPTPGLHSFKLIYKVKAKIEEEVKTIEAVTEPIELY